MKAYFEMPERPTVDEVDELQRYVEELLQGKNPLLIGAVLADVVAKLFAGHDPAIRQQAMDLWIETMRDLIKVNEARIAKQYGLDGWGDPN